MGEAKINQMYVVYIGMDRNSRESVQTKLLILMKRSNVHLKTVKI